MSMCSSINACVCLRRQKQMLGIVLKSLLFVLTMASMWEAKALKKSHLPHVHGGHLAFSPALVFPFISALTLSFSLSCSVEVFGAVPSFPEAVSSLLAQF